MNQTQRGNTLLGLIIGLVLGLGIALAVAVYVTKVPVQFLNRSQTRTPEQDAAESRKNQNWDPNAPLYGKNPARPQAPAQAPQGGPAPAEEAAGQQAPVARPAAPAPAQPATPATARPASPADPLGDLANARAAASSDPFIYFVQAGAFRTQDDAEAQRAKLSLMGLDARVSEREQAGRQVWRVRVGPFVSKDDADRNKSRLESSGFEAALVRVQR